MIDFFPTGMSFVERPDNDGQGFHETLHDTGGDTAWGVTYNTWCAWQRLHNGPTTVAAFKALGKTDVYPLYRTMFWNASRCGNMGALGIQAFDVAMGSGPGTAARFLQHVLKVNADGQIGPATIAALHDADPAKVNAAFCTEREAFYATLPTARYFERGWDRRAEDCRAFVASLLASKY